MEKIKHVENNKAGFEGPIAIETISKSPESTRINQLGG